MKIIKTNNYKFSQSGFEGLEYTGIENPYADIVDKTLQRKQKYLMDWTNRKNRARNKNKILDHKEEAQKIRELENLYGKPVSLLPHEEEQRRKRIEKARERNRNIIDPDPRLSLTPEEQILVEEQIVKWEKRYDRTAPEKIKRYFAKRISKMEEEQKRFKELIQKYPRRLPEDEENTKIAFIDPFEEEDVSLDHKTEIITKFLDFIKEKTIEFYSVYDDEITLEELKEVIEL